MSVCRTCLKTPAKRNIIQLEKEINNGNKDYHYIMLFCLDIKVTEDSNITTNLCQACFKNIVSFYKFKELSLKHDAYLKFVAAESLKGNKFVTSVDANSLKKENGSDSDDVTSSIEETFELQVMKESDVQENDALRDTQSDEELLSVLKKEKYKHVDNINKDQPKESVLTVKKHARLKKVLPLKIESNDTKNEQQVCPSNGKSVCSLKKHSNDQPKTKPKKIPCRMCDKVFCSRSAVGRHIKISHLEVKEKCDICDKEVAWLKQHKLRKHHQSELPVGCVLCGRRFISQTMLDQHMTTHSKDRPHECDVCHKTFKSKHPMELHKRRVHDEERLHLCQICSKAFFNKHCLQVHLRSHTEDKLHTCPDCNKSFNSSNMLKKHLLIHSGGKSH